MMNFFNWFASGAKRQETLGIERLMTKVSEDVRALIAAGKKPYAVRLFRQQTGATLHQALRVINALQSQLAK